MARCYLVEVNRKSRDADFLTRTMKGIRHFNKEHWKREIQPNSGARFVCRHGKEMNPTHYRTVYYTIPSHQSFRWLSIRLVLNIIEAYIYIYIFNLTCPVM